MGQHQRQRVAAPAALLDEVHLQAIDPGPELREAVQRALGRPPVEAVCPGGEQVLEVVQISAVVPADASQLVGPPGAGDARPEVVED